MKVEFLINQVLGDGYQLFISAEEFLKADKNDEEFDGLEFAAYAFFYLYGLDYHLDLRHYNVIKQHLKKNGAVIFAAYKERPYASIAYPGVYVVNDSRYEQIDFSEIE